MARTYTTIDLCAGIGGIRRGFELSGHNRFRNVLSAEIDRYASQTYQRLFHEDVSPQNDLTSPDFKERAEEAAADILLAGFPCQAFSRVGLKLGFADHVKGTIFFHLYDIIERTRPKAVFLENVENLLNHDHQNTINTIIQCLEEGLNYRIVGVTRDENGALTWSRNSLLRNSKNFGLPQSRPRVYLMAFDAERYEGLMEGRLPAELPHGRDGDPIIDDLAGVIEPRVDPVYYMSRNYWNTLKRHKRAQARKDYGFGYRVVYGGAAGEHGISSAILATGGSGKETNLVKQPVPEYAGMRHVGSKKSALNREGIRFMTPTEWGRLQGFIGYAFVNPETGEDEFSFPEKMSRAQKMKQFGNSVTIPVIEEMAKTMYDSLEAMEDEIDRRLGRIH